MTTITATTKAWISEHSRIGPDDLKNPSVVNELVYYAGDFSLSGFTYAGVATITVELVDSKTLVDNKVLALREQVKKIRADSTAQVTRIESQIQQLLCIENQATEPA